MKKEKTPIKEVVRVTADVSGWHKQHVPNLILHVGAKRIAEIGVYKGRLMRYVMRSLASSVIEEWHAVDIWQSNELLYPGCGDQAAWDEHYYSVCKYMPWFKQLRVYRAPSLRAALMFPNGYFDMVYLDGDHSREAVTKDIKAWLPKVRRGGILAGHDYDPGHKLNRDWNDVDGAVDSVFGDDFTLLKCTVWYKEVV